jgi:cytochrome c peroxidase
MNLTKTKTNLLVFLFVLSASGKVLTQGQAHKSSYLPVATNEEFSALMNRMKQEKADLASKHRTLLETRYDLTNRPTQGVTMARGKPVQGGIRVKLPGGMTWDKIAQTAPDEIRDKDLFPAGFLPLPHPNHAEGGMKKQEERDLTRFDLDYDLPDHFLPEFPAPIFLTTRPDLGDVSKGKLVTIENFFDLFNGVLNPKQLEGLRLLLTPFPQ